VRNWLNRLWKQLPRTTGRGGRRRSTYRPSVESLEHRLVPAFNLTVGAGPTAGVLHDNAGNFTANATGATISVSDILKDLQAGKSVHISDGTAGQEAGNITWLGGNDLDYRGIGSGGLGLTLTADRSALSGIVVLNSRIFDSATPAADFLAVTVSARGNLQVNNNILAGAAPISLAADVNPDGSGNAGTGVLSIGPGVTVSGSTVTLRGADIAIDASSNPATVTATGGNQSYLATPVSNPNAVAVDSHGNLYVGNAIGGTVIKQTPAGVLTTYATGFSDVGGLAFDAAGNLYVSDWNRGTVSKVTPAGVVTVYASGLSNPRGLAFDAHGNLFVANSAKNTVVEVTPAGVVSTLPFTFSGPLGLTFDSHGNLYVANTFNGTVSKVAGNTVSTYLTGFFGPQGIAFDAQGNFYVTETGKSFVTRVTPTGTRSTFVQFTAGGGAIAFDAQGNLYVGDLYYNQVRKVTPAGVASVVVSNSKYVPQGVGIDAAGNLYFASPAGGSVSKLTPAGVLTTWTGFNTPATVAVDARGNVYVANYGNGTVSKFTPAGIVSTFASGFTNPNGLAFDAQGNLYVANFGNGTISEVTPDGTVSTFVGGFQNPTGLAFDSAGDLYIADETANTVYKFIPGIAIVPFVTGLNKPIGLTFDARGNLYVANFGANTVLEVGPNTSVLATFSGFHGPYGLAFDAQGNLLVSNNAGASFARLNVGSVTVRSSLPTRPIQVGGGSPVAGVNLSFAELARIIAPGSLTIGDTTQTGNITFNNVSLSIESLQVVESSTGPGRIILDDAFQTFGIANSHGAVNLTAGTGGIQAVHTTPATTDVFATLFQMTTPGSVGSLIQPLSVFVTDLGPGSVSGSVFLSDRSPLTAGGPITVGVSAYLTLLDNFFSHAGDIVARAINLTFAGNQDEQFDSGGQVFNNVLHKGEGTLRLVGDGLTVKSNLTNAPGAGNFDANDLPVTVAGLTTIDGGTYLAGAGTQVFTAGLVVNSAFVGGSGTVTTGGVTISLYGTFIAPTTTLYDTGNWTDAGGIFDANGGTVVFSGNVTQTIDAGWQDFNNVTHSGKGLLSVALSPLTVDGKLINSPGAGGILTNGLVLTILNMM
jgi:sugar lactone lactonase YvrE